jgi:hypothetical protein
MAVITDLVGSPFFTRLLLHRFNNLRLVTYPLLAPGRVFGAPLRLEKHNGQVYTFDIAIFAPLSRA